MNLSIAQLHAALWLAIVLNGIVAVAIRRRLVEVQYLLRTIDVPLEKGLPPGAAAPDFAIVLSRSGRRVTAGTLRGRVSALVFLSARCSACRTLIASLSSAPYDDRFILVWDGDANSVPDVGAFDVATGNVGSIARSYRIERFPTAVVIDESGLVSGHGHPRRYEDVLALVSASEREAAHA